MLPNLSALALGRQEAPTEGLFGKKKTPEEKEEAKKAKVIAEFRALFVEFFRSACRYYEAGMDVDAVLMRGFKKRADRRKEFAGLDKRAPLCEGKKSDKVRLPHRVWWNIVYHYETNEKIITEKFPNHFYKPGKTIFFDFNTADQDDDLDYTDGTVWQEYYMDVVYWRSVHPARSAEEWATEFLEAPAQWVGTWTAERKNATAPPKKKEKKKGGDGV